VLGILKNSKCILFEEAYKEEHSLEVQIPFLQKVLKNFKIIPLLYGDISFESLADVISEILDKDSLIVVSSDLSHYRKYTEAKKIDSITIEAIKKIDESLVSSNKLACGKLGILALLKLAKINNWQCKFIKYLNSGDTAGPKDRVVGYASLIFI